MSATSNLETAAEWVPDPAETVRVADVIVRGSKVDAASQQRLNQDLLQLGARPDFSMYLLQIASSAQIDGVASQDSVHVRAKALLILKNVLQYAFTKLPLVWRKQIVVALFGMVRIPEPLLRSSLASCMSSILPYEPAWPSLLQGLLQLLGSDSKHAAEVAFWALHRICEDHTALLANCEPGPSHPLSTILPKFIQVFQSPSEDFRCNAVATINLFLEQEDISFMLAYMDPLVKGLLQLHQDPSVDVRVELAKAFCNIIYHEPIQLSPVIDALIVWMIQSSGSEFEELALAALEFWPNIAMYYDFEVFKQALFPRLPVLLPLLLKNMIYSEEQREARMKNPYDDPAVPDRDQDIRPCMHNSRQIVGLSDQDEGGEEEDDDDDDVINEWTVRQASAKSLEKMASLFGEKVMPIVFPEICNRMAAQQPWDVKESAVLALGAIQNGSSACLSSSRVSILGFLIELMNHEQKLVRSIACWTMSRFSIWVLEDEELCAEFLERIVITFLERMLDPFKCVRATAITGLAYLTQRAGWLLARWLEPIIGQMVSCLKVYQKKNRLILYDLFDRLATALPEEIAAPKVAQAFVPLLLQQWQNLANDDMELCLLMQAMSTLTSVMGLSFQNCAKALAARCFLLWETALVSEKENNMKPTEATIFMIQAIDLLGGLADGLHESFFQVIEGSKIKLLLFETLKNPHSKEIYQSALALVGDVARCAFPFFDDVVPQFLDLLATNFMDLTKTTEVCHLNNALWATGEIALRYGSRLKPIATPLLTLLVRVLVNESEDLAPAVKQNAAVTIGRVSLVCSELVAPHLEQFAEQWMDVMRMAPNNQEKVDAFMGIVKAIQLNPQGVFEHFAYVCDAISSWDPKFLPPPLAAQFREILFFFRNEVGTEQWQSFLNDPEFDPTVRECLQQLYGL